MKHITDEVLAIYIKAITSDKQVYTEYSDLIDEVEAHAAICKACDCKIKKYKKLWQMVCRNRDTIKAALVNSRRSDTRSISGVCVKLTVNEDIRYRAVSVENAKGMDLLKNDVLMTIDESRSVKLRCRESSGKLTLFVYSSDDIDITLKDEVNEIPYRDKRYDDVLEEYVYSYVMKGSSFELYGGKGGKGGNGGSVLFERGPSI